MNKSYIEILTELEQSIDTDCCKPSHEKKSVLALLGKLFHLLYNYSY